MSGMSKEFMKKRGARLATKESHVCEVLNTRENSDDCGTRVLVAFKSNSSCQTIELTFLSSSVRIYEWNSLNASSHSVSIIKLSRLSRQLRDGHVPDRVGSLLIPIVQLESLNFEVRQGETTAWSSLGDAAGLSDRTSVTRDQDLLVCHRCKCELLLISGMRLPPIRVRSLYMNTD